MRKVLTEKNWANMEVMPATEADEIIQNIGTILSIPQGSAPMCRNVGLSNEAFMKPDVIGKALLTRDCFSAVAEQEERAQLMSVDFEWTERGKWGATLEVEI